MRDDLAHVCLPVKGKGTVETQAWEAADAFQAARCQHPAVESAIHALECPGRVRVRNHGQADFDCKVAQSTPRLRGEFRTEVLYATRLDQFIDCYERMGCALA